MVSKFKRAVPRLAEHTGLPIFQMMLADGKPRPMKVGLGKIAIEAAPVGHRRKVRHALHLLTHSKRYLQSCVADDAIRFDENGLALGLIPSHEKEWARKRLEEYKTVAPESVAA